MALVQREKRSRTSDETYCSKEFLYDEREIKKQKLEPELEKRKTKAEEQTGNPKLDSKELMASAFALASLASSNSKVTSTAEPKYTLTSTVREPVRNSVTEEEEEEDVKEKSEGEIITEEESSIFAGSIVEISGSPRADPVPITPDSRSIFRNSKKVHFASTVKEYRSPRPIRAMRGLSGFAPPPYRPPPTFSYHPRVHPPSGFGAYPGIRQQPPPPWMHPSSNRMIRTRTMQPQHIPPVESNWVCDYCNNASFSTYEEACIHEEQCKHRYLNANSEMRAARVPQIPYRSNFASRGGPLACSSTSIGGTMTAISRADRRPKVAVSVDEQDGPFNVADDGKHVASTQDWFSGTVSLSIPDDPEWLSEINCYIRMFCIEAFATCESDICEVSKRGTVTPFQVGIRCRYCKHRPLKERAVAAVSYPTTVAGIYESVKRWQRVHLDYCEDVPAGARARISELHSTNVWIPTSRQYWTDSARHLGMVDTECGIRFSIDPKLLRNPNRKETNKPVAINCSRGAIVHQASFSSTGSNTTASLPPPQQNQQGSLPDGSCIVYPEDMRIVPPYVHFLMSQVESCHFSEVDRFVARSKGPVGYPGFQCLHCSGHAGLGKYFPVSAKTLSTNSTSQNIHAHLLKCRKCPEQIKEKLVNLKLEKSRSPRLEPGWRKIFFDKVWKRLHGP